jgi:pyruvate kinase
VELSDGIMVARGDLGVEMNPWDVPVLQKRIVETCKLLGRPVVIATQMMESMIEQPTPTRAEASDCATAIYDSCDAVMLSAESAAGKYPIEAVTMQQLVINKVETDATFQTSLDRYAQELDIFSGKDCTSTAITLAARQVADISKSKAIVAFTSSGNTAMRVARTRPKVPIIAACEDLKLARYLALVWGVYPVLIDKHVGEFVVNDALRKACKVLVEHGFADPATDLLTVTMGLPWGTPGTTNIIRVCSAAGPEYWSDKDGKITNM